MTKILFVISFAIVTLSGCISVPKETVELSEITEYQTSELQKSHLKFIELYYGKLRDDVNRFIDDKWAPTFLAKAVNNKAFRADLDEAYLTSSISVDDITVQWKGNNLQDAQKAIVLKGVKNAIDIETGKLGQVLIEWSKEAQSQISKKRKELLDPVNEQERFVKSTVNQAFNELQYSQSTIKAYLSSAVDLKEKQDQLVAKIADLKEVEDTIDKIVSNTEKLTNALESDDADKAIEKFLEMIESLN
ncbi:MAG: hypothetical protein GYB30_05665 [Gammaproteobacteria bacterium]|nr:hypothetical protein [Gammaproteobacteria bacterium]